MSKKSYLESLQERVLIFDGAMGTSVQRYNLTPEEFGGPQFEGCNDYLCVTNPRIIERRIVKLESVSLRLYKLHGDCRSVRHVAREFPAECCRKVATIARRGRAICLV